MNTPSYPGNAKPGTALPEASALPASQPWWRHGHVWLVIGGPAVVVVASFITLGLALRQSDPVIAGDAYRQGVQVDRSVAPGPDKEGARALMPALQARNHAVSPSPPTAASGPR